MPWWWQTAENVWLKHFNFFFNHLALYIEHFSNLNTYSKKFVLIWLLGNWVIQLGRSSRGETEYYSYVDWTSRLINGVELWLIFEKKTTNHHTYQRRKLTHILNFSRVYFCIETIWIETTLSYLMTRDKSRCLKCHISLQVNNQDAWVLRILVFGCESISPGVYKGTMKRNFKLNASFEIPKIHYR